MNNFQSIESGKGELMDNYPSAAYEALKKRKSNLRAGLKEKAASLKDAKMNPAMPRPTANLKPKSRGF